MYSKKHVSVAHNTNSAIRNWSGMIGIAVIYAVLSVATPFSATAQQQTILLRGFVMDASNGQTIVGANILIENLDLSQPVRGTATNSDGYYFISDIEPGSYSIRISYIGYQTLEDTLTFNGEREQITYTVELEPGGILDEIVIVGQSGGATTLSGGRQRLAPEDLGRISTPSVSGDLANYLQTLPSVVSAGDRGGALFIRGGSPDENMILMDKMPIFRPFHIVGFYSAFSQDLISGADVYAGGFPAKYSGRMSAVIDVTMRGGNQERFEGSANIGPFLSGVTIEGPINDNGVSFLASGRFSQIERTAPVFLGTEQPLKFGDQFVKIQSASETSRCGMTGLHTYDRGQIDPDRNEIFSWSNYAFGGRCIMFAPGSSSPIDISMSSSYVSIGVGEGERPQREASLWHLLSTIDMGAPLRGGGEVQSGIHIRIDNPTYTLGEQFQRFRSDSDFILGVRGYLGATIPIGPKLEVNPGLSVDASFDYALTLEPRLRATWRPFGSSEEQLSAAFGFYKQTIVGITDERDLGSTFTAWLPAPLENKRPYAWHMILGWRQQIGNFGLTAEGYYKNLGNLAVPIWSTIARFTTELTSAKGTAWGFDLRGEFSTRFLYGYIGYGFNWVRYDAGQDNFGVWYGEEIQSYHPAHDQRHSINVVINADVDFALLNVLWQFGSGRPYTQPFGFDSLIPLSLLQDPRNGYGTPRLLYERPYQGRLPAYHRLDVSMERVFEIGGAALTVKGGGINIYDRRNLFYFDLFTFKRIDQLPLIPYLAVEFATN